MIDNNDSAGEFDLILRISASNAKPTSRRLKVHSRFRTFPNEPGRIVEFIDVDLIEPQGLENN
jgi:hypothetical protein